MNLIVTIPRCVPEWLLENVKYALIDVQKIIKHSGFKKADLADDWCVAVINHKIMFLVDMAVKRGYDLVYVHQDHTQETIDNLLDWISSLGSQPFKVSYFTTKSTSVPLAKLSCALDQDRAEALAVAAATWREQEREKRGIATLEREARAKEIELRVAAAHRRKEKREADAALKLETGKQAKVKEPKQPRIRKRIPQPKLVCPHCGKTGNRRIRYNHFDNCKMKTV